MKYHEIQSKTTQKALKIMGSAPFFDDLGQLGWLCLEHEALPGHHVWIVNLRGKKHPLAQPKMLRFTSENRKNVNELRPPTWKPISWFSGSFHSHNFYQLLQWHCRSAATLLHSASRHKLSEGPSDEDPREPRDKLLQCGVGISTSGWGITTEIHVPVPAPSEKLQRLPKLNVVELVKMFSENKSSAFRKQRSVSTNQPQSLSSSSNFHWSKKLNDDETPFASKVFFKSPLFFSVGFQTTV